MCERFHLIGSRANVRPQAHLAASLAPCLMIVTCSNCAARYAVDPLAVGPGGRTVECARCHHRWFQRVEAPPLPPDLVIRPPSPGATAQLPAVIEPKPDFGWNRVLAVAERDFGSAGDIDLDDAAIDDLTFLGFLAFADPVRTTAKAALRNFR